MSRPFLRWSAPLGVAAVVIGVGVTASALSATADPTLPPRSAAQLLVDLQTSSLEGFSGTVSQSADLGLPGLPGMAGGSGSASLNSLISGSHTLRVWYAGPEKVRVALLGKLGESDVIRNGRDVWVWSSNEKQAQHKVLPEEMTGKDAGPADPSKLLPSTPQEAADKVLAALDPSTVVSTAGTARVAGRAAYELVLAPRDAGSLISQVRLAIDGEKHVPLRVQVNARGATAPAFEVGFQQVAFTRPGDEQFTFTPPPGTKVDEPGTAGATKPDGHDWIGKPGTATEPKRPDGKQPDAEQPDFKTAGSGWTTVLVGHLPAGDSKEGNPLGAFVNTLPPVSGDWGSGHLLQSHLLTVLITNDGRVLAGAVSPDRLFATAKTTK